MHAALALQTLSWGLFELPMGGGDTHPGQAPWKRVLGQARSIDKAQAGAKLESVWQALSKDGLPCNEGANRTGCSMPGAFSPKEATEVSKPKAKGGLLQWQAL